MKVIAKTAERMQLDAAREAAARQPTPMSPDYSRGWRDAMRLVTRALNGEST